MPNVLGIFSGKKRPLGGCEIYRTTMPYNSLEESGTGWHTSYAFFKDLWEMAHGKEGLIADLLLKFDLIVFNRLYFKDEGDSEFFEFVIEFLHAHNIHVVYEVDDDFTNEDRIVIGGDAMGVAKRCDAITVTTKYLSNLMEDRTGKKAYVLPNMFDPEVWHYLHDTHYLYKDKITLGLTGSTSHKNDWRILETVLPDLMQDNGLHLLVMGYTPDYLEGLPNTTYIPPIAYQNYVQVIQSCDIILAPVNNDPFNLSKSAIKVIEGMAARRKVNDFYAGAATIASDHPIYNQTIQHEKTGLLVPHTHQGWMEGLDRLVYDQKLRQRIQIAGHEWIDRHHNIKKKVVLWDNAYNAILKKPILVN